MPNSTNSGIRTDANGAAYIPASKRADGTTRKALRVRPGFTPQEDVETYKSRNAEAWKNRGAGGVPGADEMGQSTDTMESKSKNAKRREAAKKKQAAASADTEQSLVEDMNNVDLSLAKNVEIRTQSATGGTDDDHDDVAEAERQKRIRNLLKKLGGIRELRMKKSEGLKLSPDQLMKLGREQEILRDLKKLDYEDVEPLQNDERLATDIG